MSAWLLLLGKLHALGPSPGFNMDACVGQAEHIMIGKLSFDGTLKDAKSIRGKMLEPITCRIESGDVCFQAFNKFIGGNQPMEVIAFISDTSIPESYRLATGMTGLIAFTSTDGVCGWFSDDTRAGNSLKVHESWTRKKFLAALDQSLEESDDLDRILESPRSPQRIETLFRFMKENIDWSKVGPEDPYSWRWNVGFVFHKCLRGLTHPSPVEEAALGDQLKNATFDDETAMTLAVIANIGCSKSLYDPVRPYLSRTKAGKVRKQGFRALMGIDPYSGSGLLAGLLHPDDPDLEGMISALGEYGLEEFSRKDPLNKAVLYPLLRFSDKALASSRSGEKNQYRSLGYAVAPLLQHYYHPILIPTMMRWANDKTTKTHAQASSHLRRALLGDESTPVKSEQLDKWWKQSSNAVSQNFDLDSTNGCEQWLGAWKEAENIVAKRLLLRLWDFQREIPEAVLLEFCEGKNADAAKMLLSELWQRNRLSVETQKILVQKHNEL